MAETQQTMTEFTFAPGEKNIIGDRFSPSVIIFWLKTSRPNSPPNPHRSRRPPSYRPPRNDPPSGHPVPSTPRISAT